LIATKYVSNYSVFLGSNGVFGLHFSKLQWQHDTKTRLPYQFGTTLVRKRWRVGELEKDRNIKVVKEGKRRVTIVVLPVFVYGCRKSESALQANLPHRHTNCLCI